MDDKQEEETRKIESLYSGEEPEKRIVITKKISFDQIGKWFKKLFGASALILLCISSIYAADCKYNGKLPDAECTPGAINPFVTQDNIQSTICVAGFTGKIRPSVARTNRIKAIVMQKYGFKGKPAEVELDHKVPLELGGAPLDIKNLWPQPYAPKPAAREKDIVETHLHKLVCNGEMTLKAAQVIISQDWLTYYKQLKGGLK